MSRYGVANAFISIHAPHEGVRLDFSNFPIRIFISIHAPHEGVRLNCDAAISIVCISIHAPHEGVRQRFELYQESIYDFNPRTPRGGATAICCSLISRVTTCCRPNITPLLDVVRFLNYCTNLLLFLGEPPRLFRTASGSPMSLHY